jgi:hypothetical protein
MRNITLSASESLIDAAREKAREQNKTLNQAFREWLEDYTRHDDPGAIESLYERLSYLNLAGPKMTREQMNER